jgi:hypothetical protein
MNGKSDVFVHCQVSNGMFDSEVAVLIQLPNGEKVSLFADKTLIQEIKGETFLKVSVTEADEGKGEQTVLLPSESFEKGSRWLSVPTKSLAFA